MNNINKGKIFLKAAIRSLIVGIEELPVIGVTFKMGKVFWDTWVTELKNAQDALPEVERAEQLEQAAAITPQEARQLAQAMFVELQQQRQEFEPQQQEAVLDITSVLPARIRERTHATLSHAKRFGTAAQVVLPLTTRAALPERATFYRSLLPISRPLFQPGATLPNTNPEWKLVELLGIGGFGEVWHCRHNYLGKEQAVKFCQDQANITIMQNEAKNLYRLQQILPEHPHIVRLYDLQLRKQPFWLAFEYVTGGTLESLIRARGVMPEAEALQLLVPLWQALAEVHKLGIVHRDIKPANILLDAQGRLKLSDFGIGKVMAEKMAVTMHSRRAQSLTMRGYGTLNYMSPEQEGGKIAHPADDTYALGIVLWQMLVGSLDTLQYPKNITALNVTEKLKRLLIACRFSPREERPQHAGALLELLDKTFAPVTQPKPVISPPSPVVAAPSTPLQLLHLLTKKNEIKKAHESLIKTLTAAFPEQEEMNVGGYGRDEVNTNGLYYHHFMEMENFFRHWFLFSDGKIIVEINIAIDENATHREGFFVSTKEGIWLGRSLRFCRRKIEDFSTHLKKNCQGLHEIANPQRCVMIMPVTGPTDTLWSYIECVKEFKQ